MNEEEQDRFEAELRRATPAPAPADFLERLRAAKIDSQTIRLPTSRRISGLRQWVVGWRWALAATPVAIAAIVLIRTESRPAAVPHKVESAAAPGIKANAFEVDHALVSSFEAVAELPGGEPVRFRCRQWVDDVVMSDDSHGVVIQRSSPRIEVIPVRFETY